MIAAWVSETRLRLRLLAMLRDVRPDSLTWLLAAHAVGALCPSLTALAAGWVVLASQPVAENGTAATALAVPILGLVIAFVITEVTESSQEFLAGAAADDVDGRVRHRLRAAAAKPRRIAVLERVEVQDDLRLASDVSGSRRRSVGMAVTGQVTLTARLATSLVSALVVAWFSPVLALVLLGASLACRWLISRQWMGLASVVASRSGRLRRVGYLTELLTDASAARDVRTYGLQQWLTDHRDRAIDDALGPVWSHRRRILKNQGPVVLLSTGSAFLALFVPRVSDLAGSPGGLVTCLLAGIAVLSISGMGREPFDIEYGTAALGALDRLQAVLDGPEPTVATPPTSLPPGPVTAGPPAVGFESVSFAYEFGQPVLDGLELRVAPGEVVALIGVNGAGKTTLAKLLAGLYAPQGGRVTLDGQDVATLPVDQVRRRLSVTFQDFVHYPGKVRENLTAGAPEHAEDEAGLQAALVTAHAEELVASLPRGIDTLLWKQGADGRELSGGQWQKLALARAAFAAAHGRDILVLDEPTAHLDVTAEIEFFDRITEIAEGRTLLLISHRLSTIRRADRIVLISNGRITEQGSHDSLVEADGEYARLFRLQADRFAEAAES